MHQLILIRALSWNSDLMDAIQTNVQLEEAVPEICNVRRCLWWTASFEILEQVTTCYPVQDEVVCFTVFEGGVAFDDMLGRGWVVGQPGKCLHFVPVVLLVLLAMICFEDVGRVSRGRAITLCRTIRSAFGKKPTKLPGAGSFFQLTPTRLLHDG